jgi:hypothetical protein
MAIPKYSEMDPEFVTVMAEVEMVTAPKFT